MPILGIISSGISGNLAPAAGYYSLATSTVGSGGAAYVEFTNISNQYKHLQIRISARDTRGVAANWALMQFNSDTNSNYSDHMLFADGTSVTSGYDLDSKIWIFTQPGSTATANYFNAAIVDILDYSNLNKFKTVRALAGFQRGGAGQAGLIGANWRSTNAISSIKIYPEIGRAHV